MTKSLEEARKMYNLAVDVGNGNGGNADVQKMALLASIAASLIAITQQLEVSNGG